MSNKPITNKLHGFRSAIKLPIFLYGVCFFISGCAGRVMYFDDSGKQVPPLWTDSFKLADCPLVSFDGKKYQTPTGRRQELEHDIEPFLKECAFCPPDMTGKAMNCWSGIRMKNGDILVCAGEPHCKVPNNRSWIIDSKTKQIRTGPKLIYPCLSPSMLLLKNGSILVTGGFLEVPDMPTAQAQLFEPESGKFRALEKMCLPRVEHEMVQLDNGSVLVVAGRIAKDTGGEETGQTSTVELFDPQNERFQLAGNLKYARTGPIVKALTPSEAFVVGGFMTLNNTSRDDYWLGDDWEIFSIAPKSRNSATAK